MKSINLMLYRIVAVLLCLVCITFSMVSNRFARYTTGDMVNSRADVAAFNVEITYGGIIDEGLVKYYPITISNKSEVLAGFSKVVVQFQEPLPKNITLVLTDMEDNPLCEAQVSDSLSKEFVFIYEHTLQSRTETHFQLRLAQDERSIYDEFAYTTRLMVTVYQLD